MAISPTKPDFYDGTWRGKIRVWAAPLIDTGASSFVVPGLKRVFDVSIGGGSARPGTTFTYTTTGASNSAVVLTLTVTASSTGNVPLVVYGQ